VQSLKEEIERLKSQNAELGNKTSERDEMQSTQSQRVRNYGFINERPLKNVLQIEALEASIRSHKEQHVKNTKGFRDRLGQLNNEKSTMNTTISDLNTKLKVVTAERDALKAAPAQSNDSSLQELTQQLESLRHEKATVEKLLEEEKAKPKGASDQSSEHAALIVCTCHSRLYFPLISIRVD
jgi:nucleoprotein TPR